jgi:hypothetical protein
MPIYVVTKEGERLRLVPDKDERAYFDALVSGDGRGWAELYNTLNSDIAYINLSQVAHVVLSEEEKVDPKGPPFGAWH